MANACVMVLTAVLSGCDASMVPPPPVSIAIPAPVVASEPVATPSVFVPRLTDGQAIMLKIRLSADPYLMAMNIQIHSSPASQDMADSLADAFKAAGWTDAALSPMEPSMNGLATSAAELAVVLENVLGRPVAMIPQPAQTNVVPIVLAE